jgi:Holliday junction resolvase
MVLAKRKGYRVERNIKIFFEKNGWKVIRAGASLGEADLICIKNARCLLLQVKSTKKAKFYYYDYMKEVLEGFPFLLVVDFGYGKVRVLPPKKVVCKEDGIDLKTFILKPSE